MRTLTLLTLLTLLLVPAHSLTPPTSITTTATNLASLTFSFTLTPPLPTFASVKYTQTNPTPTATTPTPTTLFFPAPSSWDGGSGNEYTLRALTPNTTYSVEFTTFDADMESPNRNASTPSPPLLASTSAGSLSCDSPVSFSNQASLASRFRGAFYTMGPADAILVDFGLQLNVPSGVTLHYAVYEKLDGQSVFTTLLDDSRLTTAGESSYAYHSGPGKATPRLSIPLRANAEYIIGSYSDDPAPMYFFSASPPPVSSFCFGTLSAGAAESLTGPASAGVNPADVIATSGFYGIDVIVAAADALPPSPPLDPILSVNTRPTSVSLSPGTLVFQAPSLQYHAFLTPTNGPDVGTWTRADLGTDPDALTPVFGLSANTTYAVYQAVSVFTNMTPLNGPLSFDTPPLPTLPPSQAPVLTPSVVGRAIELAWTDTDAYPTGFRIEYRVADSASPFSSLTVGYTLSTSLSLLAYGTEYEIQVTSFNALGSSPPSAPVRASIPNLLCVDSWDLAASPSSFPTTSSSITGYFSNVYMASVPLAVADIKVHAVYDGIRTFRFLIRAVDESDPGAATVGFPHVSGPSGVPPPSVLLDTSITVEATSVDSPIYKSSGPVQAILVPGKQYHIGVIVSGGSISTVYMDECGNSVCLSTSSCMSQIGSSYSTSVAIGDDANSLPVSPNVRDYRYDFQVAAIGLAPSGPTNLRLDTRFPVISTSAYVRWNTPVSGDPAGGYTIQVSSSSSSGPFVDVVYTSSNSAQVTGLAPGVTQYIRVVITSAPTLVSDSVLTVTPPSLPLSVPPAVQNLAASFVQKNAFDVSLSVSFSPAPTAERYELHFVLSRSDVSILDLGLSTVVNVTQPFISSSPFTFTLSVVAFNSLGASPPSPILTLTYPGRTLPPAPTPGPAGSSSSSSSSLFIDIDGSELSSCPVGWRIPSTSSYTSVRSHVGTIFYASETVTIDHVALGLASFELNEEYAAWIVNVYSSPTQNVGFFSSTVYRSILSFATVRNVFGTTSADYDGAINVDPMDLSLPGGKYYLITVQIPSSTSFSVLRLNPSSTSPLYVATGSGCDPGSTSKVLTPVASSLDTSTTSSLPSPPPPPPTPVGAPPSPPSPPPPYVPFPYRATNLDEVYALAVFIQGGNGALFSMPPRQAQVALAYPTSLDVTWRRPLFSTPNSYVIEYRVRTTPPSGPWMSVSADPRAAVVESVPDLPCFVSSVISPLPPNAEVTVSASSGSGGAPGSGLGTRTLRGGCVSPSTGDDTTLFYFYFGSTRSSSSSSWDLHLDGEELSSGRPSELTSAYILPSSCGGRRDEDDTWYRWGPYTIAPGEHTYSFYAGSSSDRSVTFPPLVVENSNPQGDLMFQTRLTGLVPGTDYDVRVVSVVSGAIEPRSYATPAVTGAHIGGTPASGASVRTPDLPTSAPSPREVDVVVTGVVANLTWSLGSARDPEYVTRVDVWLYPVDTGLTQTLAQFKSVSRESCRASFSGLKEFTDYAWNITFINDVGSSLQTAPAAFRTGASFGVSSKPSYLSKSVVGILFAVGFSTFFAVCFGLKAVYDRAVFPEDYQTVAAPPPAASEMVAFPPSMISAVPPPATPAADELSSDELDGYGGGPSSKTPVFGKLPSGGGPGGESIPIYPVAGSGPPPELPSYGEAIELHEV